MRISDWSSDVCSSDLITKPSLYRLFGDKRALFLRALERYAQTHGSPAIEAFDAAQRIEVSVAAFLNAAIETQTGDGGPTGCLLACVASTQAENDEAVRAFYLAALSSTVSALTERFAAAKPPHYVNPSAEEPRVGKRCGKR